MKQAKASSGKLIFWLFLIVFFWVLVTHFAKTKEVFAVLAAGKWYWIILAIACQFLFYPLYAYFLESVFKIFRVDFYRKMVLPVYMATKFTDVTLPIATVGKVIVFVRFGKKHQLSPLNTGIGISFVLISEVLGFIIVSAIGLLFMSLFGHERVYLTVALLFLVCVALLILSFLIKLVINKETPSKFFLWIIRIVSKMAGQGSVQYSEIEKIFLEIGRDLQNSKNKLLPAIMLATSTHLINLLTFAFIFVAFAGHFNFFAIVAGYTAGLLFTIISITPQGVGVAEAVMVTTLRSFGIDISTAAVVVLAFRGLLYWLPLFVGFYFFSRLELKNGD